MSDDERRRILTAVAGGQMAPSVAADALDALGEPTADRPDMPPPPDLARVRVVASARAVRVVGDPGVREAVADGPHELRREGDTLVVSGDTDDVGGGGFVSSGPGWRVRAHAGSGPRTLTVRMHPDLALDAEVSAGSLDVAGVRGPIRGEMAAATVRITGFAGPLDLETSAGRIDASGVLAGGSSRVRCHAGRLTMRLEHGSSVRINGRTTVGKMVLPGDGDPGPAARGPLSDVAGKRGPLSDVAGSRRGGRRLGDERQALVGDGAGTLDVEVNTGTAVIRADP